jgi:hypothetical protein
VTSPGVVHDSTAWGHAAFNHDRPLKTKKGGPPKRTALKESRSAYSTLRKYRFPVPDAGATYGLAAPDTFENGPVIEVADWSVPV